MSENKLPNFESIDEVVDFFDSHDLGEYDLPEVECDVSIQRNRESRPPSSPSTESQH